AERAAAIRSQRSECDVLLLQSEARHRIAMKHLRAEMAEAEARHNDSTLASRREFARHLESLQDISRIGDTADEEFQETQMSEFHVHPGIGDAVDEEFQD
ncbi:unnamed protein product, partial [Polarella glacialis]